MAETFLDRITAATRVRLAERMAERSIDDLRAEAARQPQVHKLGVALHPVLGMTELIAEIKRASPSKGVLNAKLHPQKLARRYYDAGTAAISVLTEQDFFQGSLADLQAVRQVIPDRPILRKDFITDPYQVVEARAAGADSYLLIVALLDDRTLGALIQAGREWGMEPLVEVHDAKEAQRAVAADAKIIGVNARNLHTFEVDTTLLRDIRPLIPADTVVVAESGLFTQADVARMRGYGADAVLMGEALVRADKPNLLRDVNRLPTLVLATPRGHWPVVKLCGMRTPADALAAHAAGADIIGLVFAKSKRQVTPEQAREIIEFLPPTALTVGVFADDPIDVINAAVAASGVHTVQIAESIEQGRQRRRLQKMAIIARSTADSANALPPAAADANGSLTLLESAPPGEWGGTGRTGDWSIAAKWAKRSPIRLAGGLTPDHVGEAISSVHAWGVDVSSGIEGPDGQKDPARMHAFIEAVRASV